MIQNTVDLMSLQMKLLMWSVVRLMRNCWWLDDV